MLAGAVHGGGELLGLPGLERAEFGVGGELHGEHGSILLERHGGYPRLMCRNIRCLHNFEPTTNDDEVREAALQFVRKVSGSTHPSRANSVAFDRAIEDIADATRRMLDELVTNAPPKTRESEAVKGRERHEKRMEREVRIRTDGAVAAL